VLFDYTLRSHDITLDTFFFTNPRASGSAVTFGMFHEDRSHTMLEQFVNWEQDLRFTIADSPVRLTATATSGLPVQYHINDTAVATIDGSILYLHRVGETQITATQDGDDDYLPAEPVTRILVVTQDSVGIGKPDGDISFFPNPTRRLVFIHSPSDRIVEAFLTDMTSHCKSIPLIPAGPDVYILDLAPWPAAVYLLALTTADGRLTTRRLHKIRTAVSQ